MKGNYMLDDTIEEKGNQINPERLVKRLKVVTQVEGILAIDKYVEWVHYVIGNSEKVEEFFNKVKKIEDFDNLLKEYNNYCDYKEFWKQEDLYDTEQLTDIAMFLLYGITKRYGGIIDIDWIIISGERNESTKSKLRFLQSEFPMSFQFVEAESIAEVDANVYIHQDLSVLEKCLEKNRNKYTIYVQHFYNDYGNAESMFIPDEIFDVASFYRGLMNG